MARQMIPNPIVTEYITADDLKVHDTIVERSERGNIIRTFAVTDLGRCFTDPGNVHVSASDRNGVACYYRHSKTLERVL
jgi:hypothetical protein